MKREVRVRFAPSPTGPLHIGGVRTALYNYLFARNQGGKFILRIEDTDQNRWVPGAEEYIFETLEWLGISPDESPRNDGEYSPYRQSERKSIYKDYANQLIESGNAYLAFDTPEEIEAMRNDMIAQGATQPQYNSLSRSKMRNSLTLSSEEVDQLISDGTPHVVRMKMPKKADIRFEDTVRGWVTVHSSTLDDKVLLKSDGMPTYHLANVVDDHLMNITHVIRGEEWLPSAPLHVYMYECFGWENTRPEFAHLPLLLKPDGKGKLSKRDSEKHGFPIFPLEWSDPNSGEKLSGFREHGFFPDSTLNFLAFLGWNPGDEREIFSLDELCATFSLDRIIKGGARFDYDKAKWFNEQYIKVKPTQELVTSLADAVSQEGFECSESKAERIVGLMKERVTFPAEQFSQARYFFEPPSSYDEKVVRKKWNEDVNVIFRDYTDRISKNAPGSPEEYKTVLEQTLEAHDSHLGKVMQALRVAITGLPGGPDLMEIIDILGTKETSNRIIKAVETISTS